MRYYVLQNAVTKNSVSKGNYDGDVAITKESDNKEDGRAQWHTQCVSLKNDADTYKYKCELVDSQLNVVDDLIEVYDKGTTPTPPEPNNQQTQPQES